MRGAGVAVVLLYGLIVAIGSLWVCLFVVWDAVLHSGGSESRRIASPQSALARLLGGAVVDVALTDPSEAVGVEHAARHSTGCSQFWRCLQSAREI